MRRRAALRAEIVFGLDDSNAEETLPETIHSDASRQRMLGCE